LYSLALPFTDVLNLSSRGEEGASFWFSLWFFEEVLLLVLFASDEEGRREKKKKK